MFNNLLIEFKRDMGNISFVKGEVETFDEAALHHMYYWDSCHGHPHFAYYATTSVSGIPAATKQKSGFCIENTQRVINARTTPLRNDYDCAHQGVASGWADNYSGGIPCQWVDVTNVPSPSSRSLTLTTNPKGWICEGAVTPGTGAVASFFIELTLFCARIVDSNWSFDNETAISCGWPAD